MFATVFNRCTSIQKQLVALVPPFNMSNSSVFPIAPAVSAESGFVESAGVKPARGIK